MSKNVGDLSVDELVGLMRKVVDDSPKTFFTKEVERIVNDSKEEHEKSYHVLDEHHFKHEAMHEDCFENKKEWVANHKFISFVRYGAKAFFNLAAFVAAGTFIVWVGTLVHHGFGIYIADIISGGEK